MLIALIAFYISYPLAYLVMLQNRVRALEWALVSSYKVVQNGTYGEYLVYHCNWYMVHTCRQIGVIVRVMVQSGLTEWWYNSHSTGQWGDGCD